MTARSDQGLTQGQVSVGQVDLIVSLQNNATGLDEEPFEKEIMSLFVGTMNLKSHSAIHPAIRTSGQSQLQTSVSVPIMEMTRAAVSLD